MFVFKWIHFSYFEFFRWDIKQKTTTPTHHIKAHTAEVNSIDFNSYNEYLFLTGSSDKTVALWDLRQTGQRLHSFEGHTEEVIEFKI